MKLRLFDAFQAVWIILFFFSKMVIITSIAVNYLIITAGRRKYQVIRV